MQGLTLQVVNAQAHRLNVANPSLEYRPVQLNDGSWRIRVYQRIPRHSTGPIISRIANATGDNPCQLAANYDVKSARTKGRTKLYGYYTRPSRGAR